MNLQLGASIVFLAAALFGVKQNVFFYWTPYELIKEAEAELKNE